MYEHLKGKILLILGATPSEVDLVKRAQEFGVYVIVTDYHSNWELYSGPLVKTTLEEIIVNAF